MRPTTPDSWATGGVCAWTGVLSAVPHASTAKLEATAMQRRRRAECDIIGTIGGRRSS
jgi:hypothetical protein